MCAPWRHAASCSRPSALVVDVHLHGQRAPVVLGAGAGGVVDAQLRGAAGGRPGSRPPPDCGDRRVLLTREARQHGAERRRGLNPADLGTVQRPVGARVVARRVISLFSVFSRPFSLLTLEWPMPYSSATAVCGRCVRRRTGVGTTRSVMARRGPRPPPRRRRSSPVSPARTFRYTDRRAQPHVVVGDRVGVAPQGVDGCFLQGPQEGVDLVAREHGGVGSETDFRPA